MILHSARIAANELARVTGWLVKPEGACQDDRCVPLPAGALGADGRVDVAAFADRVGMPLVADTANKLWALGPEAGGRALTSATAPDFELPDLAGRPFRLTSRRGRKVLLVAWASW